MASFTRAGYDLPFIASLGKDGLTDHDLDCVGIPLSKLGLRRKLKALHDLDQFYGAEDAGEDDDGDDEEDEDDEDEDDDDEEEDEDED